MNCQWPFQPSDLTHPTTKMGFYWSYPVLRRVPEDG